MNIKELQEELDTCIWQSNDEFGAGAEDEKHYQRLADAVKKLDQYVPADVDL